MSKDQIITLENGDKYLLLDETLLNDLKYFYAAKLKNDESDITKDYLFLKEVNKNGELYIKIEKDENIQRQLLTIFTVNYTNSALNEDINN